ncbi:MAG TPA: SdrD B-like domain-containing protein [Pyrinomonadaceae bacterium]|nr:SdrD B-like domain-containing protein [Pyrinomonadaceae bacterium]
MSKRRTVFALIVSVSAMSSLFLLSTAIAQKGLNSTAGAPIRGVDVKLGSNPGGNLVKRTTTDANGKIDWGNLAAGSYSMEIVPPSGPKITELGDANYYIVEISGPSVVGGTKKVAWEIKRKVFILPHVLETSGRTTTAPPTYSPKFQFDVGGGPPTPVQATVVKSKSNITNN